jgi:hypothetical protein
MRLMLEAIGKTENNNTLLLRFGQISVYPGSGATTQ